jgi:glutamate dehydrogenase/leucine dehydrogenase
MAGLVPLFNQTTTLQGFQITSQADMLTALGYLANGGGVTGVGYTGQINLQTAGSTNTWSLNIYDVANNHSQTALVSDWIILTNNTVAVVCKSANFTAQFHT